ncbi:MAG: N-6 DNA methylase [Deltaproteobacteria bacterium]|nr:N-6 DNA methylase [Deltaproteobacteria bacterium]
MPKRHRPGTTSTRVVAHIEEIVLATSGEDAFELVFAVAAARVTGRTIAAAAKAHPELEIEVPRGDAAKLAARASDLLGRAIPAGDTKLETLDAVFEKLVPRVAKGDKGQFFTPRSVVDFVIRALSPRAKEVVVDPACGSGAFLAHAAAQADVRTFGSDVDARAVRVARLVAIAQGRAPSTIVRRDGLRGGRFEPAQIVATNPPFAGRAPSDGFSIAERVRTPERDLLFLERSLDLLEPGGRLGIVLPYNKAANASFAGARRWLFERARVLAVVGLPRETFAPHTSQRTFVLFAKKRRRGESARDAERTMFVVSERAGKDAAGDPVLRANGDIDHDLGEALGAVRPFFAKEGFFA